MSVSSMTIPNVGFIIVRLQMPKRSMKAIVLFVLSDMVPIKIRSGH